MAIGSDIGIKCLCCMMTFITRVGEWALCEPCRFGGCERGCRDIFRVDPCR